MSSTKCYGGLRAGDPSLLTTDRTFTGQKADGTGLLYYNARYYDPALGTFLSPDTLVPDAGAVVDYNRFAYVRNNPLKYSDPSGHCATTSNGSRDTENDAQCWIMVDSILNVWDETSPYGYQYNYWNQRLVSKEVFAMIAEAPSNGVDLFVGELNRYFDYKDASDQAMTQQLQEYYQNNPSYGRDKIHPCRFWDCPAIAMDLASLGISVAQTGAVACTATGVGAPACGPAAMYLTGADIALNTGAVVYDGYQYAKGEGTLWDFSFTLADVAHPAVAKSLGRTASVTPVVGVVYDSLMLAYDLAIDPFITTGGGAKVAR